jgi:integrase
LATLGELFDEFMNRYAKLEKKSWIYDEREIPKFYGDWFNHKISSLTKQQIQKRHEEIRAKNGLYQANRALERLRAMYNKAIEWGWDGINPTNGIKKYREVKRDRFLLANETRAFFTALDMEENEVARNYFYMALFTGARKTNVLEMRWDQIDIKNAIWRIPDTKNGEPVVVSLIQPAVELLGKIPKESEWVFPNQRSASGHFEDPKKPWARILERAGIENLRIHDIRRTMGSWQALTGASLTIIGKSLGHKSTDATQIYARLSNDPVRDSMNTAIDKLMVQK